MRGRDLKCGVCGAGAVNVADDYPLDPDTEKEDFLKRHPGYDVLPTGPRGATFWACLNGHANTHSWVRDE